VPRAASGEGDGREALVLERITGNLWKSSHKQAWFHVAGGNIKVGLDTPKKIPKSTKSCDMFG
jgi:hypothetical protein